jgi:subtilase family serine protease
MMHSTIAARATRIVSLIATLALAACSGSGIPATVPAQSSTNETPTEADGFYAVRVPNAVRRVCAAPAQPNHMRCLALMRTDLHPHFTGDAKGIPAGAGFTPAEIASAYKLDQTRGKGQTVALVDAYGYAQAASDLATYRAAANLPPCTIANGCLRIVNQTGAASPLPQPNPNENDDWRPEQALDLDAVSAACPNCHIILVQADTDNTGDLYAGVNAAAALGANVISNSYGGAEGAPASIPAFNHPGHLIVASAGDNGGGLLNGGGPLMPCTFATVVCVGGTGLTKAHNARGWNEVVWDTLANDSCGENCGGTGSGCSVIVPKPSWQTDTGCTHRSAVDVSAVASVNTPLAVYSVLFKSFAPSGWAGFGGTSLSSPLIAGVFALARNASSLNGAQQIWQNHSHLNDVVKGTNVYLPFTGPCASSVAYICIAGPGYDGPTGWGTPNGLGSF